MSILLFQFAAKRNFGVFLCKFADFELVFFEFANVLVLCFFEFPCQTHVDLVFPLNYPFWACSSNLLACFFKITWHHRSVIIFCLPLVSAALVLYLKTAALGCVADNVIVFCILGKILLLKVLITFTVTLCSNFNRVSNVQSV